ncbi:MAG TPA: BamA/TamA family outer membrane protein [Coleofasciculaceae cyanobacterium]
MLMSTAGFAQDAPDSAVDRSDASSSHPQPTFTESTLASDLLIEEDIVTQSINAVPFDRSSEVTTADLLVQNSDDQNPDNGGEESDIEDELPELEKDRLSEPVVNAPQLRFGVGSATGDPTALRGLTRQPAVAALSDHLDSLKFSTYAGLNLGDNQDMLLEVQGGIELLGADLRYSFDPSFLPGVISVNLMSQQARSPSFAEGDRDVDLPNGNSIFVERLGGGVEYYQEVSPEFDFAVALNYQLISIRDGLFASKLQPKDADGNRLTLSNDGQDTLLTLNLIGLYDATDDRSFPTQGTRIRFGADQSIPVGDASIAYTRFSGSFSQFIPFRPFDRDGYPHVLILNVQTGTMLGDVPSYEAFNLGGESSVRGWRQGELATGQSFIQATAEYRFPLFDLTVLRRDVGFGGVVFVDYGNDLGSASEVKGNPGETRDKAGEGFGFGVGLQARSELGLTRLELGINDKGGSELVFTIGGRF